MFAAEFPPVGGGGVIRVVKLVKYLARLGWHITVVCSDERLANAYDDTLMAEIPSGVNIVRAGTPLAAASGSVARTARDRLGRTSILFGLLRRIRAAVRSVWAIPDHRILWALWVSRRVSIGDAPSIIVSTGPPHSVHIGAAILARRFSVPHVMDFRDEWTLRPLLRSRLPWRTWIERRMERWCMRRAASLVVVSSESADRYAAAYPNLAGRIAVIPNGYDPEDFGEMAPRTRGVGHALVIGYAGSFQEGTNVEPMFQAIGEVARRGVRFEMVGPFLPHEIEMAQRWIPPHSLSVRPFMPHRSVLRLMTEWDVLCVIATDGTTSLAGKLYECLALRRPIAVIAPEGPATRLVRGLRAGAIGQPDVVNSIRAAIESALDMARSGYGGISDEALAHYDRRRQAEQWSQLLSHLIEDVPPSSSRTKSDRKPLATMD